VPLIVFSHIFKHEQEFKAKLDKITADHILEISQLKASHKNELENQRLHFESVIAKVIAKYENKKAAERHQEVLDFAF